MHIKESPVAGVKKDFAGFQIDTSKIELHSIRKRDILLPYYGPLPAAIQDNDGAAISVTITVNLRTNVCLVITTGKKQHRYLLEATAQEVDDLLDPFFFRYSENVGRTRMDNGLSRYWLGHHQSSYNHWRRLAYEGHGLYDLISQLSPKSLESVAH